MNLHQIGPTKIYRKPKQPQQSPPTPRNMKVKKIKKRKRNIIFATRHPELRIKLAGLFGDRCYYCHLDLRMDSGNEPTIDHKTPTTRGGSDTDFNKVLCCLRCNRWKDDMTEAEFQAILNQIRSTPVWKLTADKSL